MQAFMQQLQRIVRAHCLWQPYDEVLNDGLAAIRFKVADRFFDLIEVVRDGTSPTGYILRFPWTARTGVFTVDISVPEEVVPAYNTGTAVK